MYEKKNLHPKWVYYIYIYSTQREREKERGMGNLSILSCKKVTKVETMEDGDFPSLRFDFKNIKMFPFLFDRGLSHLIILMCSLLFCVFFHLQPLTFMSLRLASSKDKQNGSI